MRAINKSNIAAWAAVLALGLLAAPAGGQGRDLYPGLDKVVTGVEARFPVVEGYVVSVQKDHILLDLKQGDPIEPGDVLQVLRYGEALTHPVTGEALGREETEIGRVEIRRVGPKFTQARGLDATTQVQTGDGVRLAFKTVAVLVAPITAKPELSLDRQALRADLEKRLRARPRLEVPDFDMSLWMLESGVSPAALENSDTLQQLRQKVAADFVLIASVQTVKNKLALHYRLISTESGGAVKEARVLLGDPAQMAKTLEKPQEQEKQSDFRSVSKNVVYVSRQEFPFEIVDFDVGDVNGDGKQEYVIIDRNRVLVFKYQDETFTRIAQFQANKHGNFFHSVDVADINGNGRDEIFVTSQSGQWLRSFALEADLQAKRFKKVWDNANLYFRVIHPFDAKPTLLAQSPGRVNPFRDGIFKIRFQEGKYQKGEKVDVPELYGTQFTVYGLNRAGLKTPKAIETFVLDKDYHLRVYSSDGRILIKSDDYYGHDPRLIDVGVEEDTPGVSRQGEPARYRGRLQLTQFGDKRFLVVPRNHRAGGNFLSKLVIINNCSLVLLALTKEGLESFFETKKQKGYLAAYQVVDVPGTGRKKIHVAAVQEGGFFSGGTISTIFTYNWNP